MRSTLAATCILVVSFISAQGAVSEPQQTQSPDFIKSKELNSEAVNLFNQGKYDEALPLETQALALREKALGPDHAELIPILTNIGEIYKRKDLGQSTAYFNRALKLAEKTYGQNDLRLATILDSLAFVEYTRKHATTAEDLFMRSLKVKESALDAHDPEIARTAFNLGQAYAARAYYKGAASMLSRAITIWESAGDKERSNLLKALESQVLVLTALGKNDEAAKAQHRLGELSSQDAIVNGGILNGKALVLITPIYPSVSFHASGIVQVQVLIDENGRVLTAKAFNSKMQIEFVRAAESAARQSRFSPTFVSGKPVKVNGIIIYNFVSR